MQILSQVDDCHVDVNVFYKKKFSFLIYVASYISYVCCCYSRALPRSVPDTGISNQNGRLH